MASFFCHVAGVAMQFRLQRHVRPNGTRTPAAGALPALGRGVGAPRLTAAGNASWGESPHGGDVRRTIGAPARAEAANIGKIEEPEMRRRRMHGEVGTARCLGTKFNVMLFKA